MDVKLACGDIVYTLPYVEKRITELIDAGYKPISMVSHKTNNVCVLFFKE